jgi:hypothetical protein
VAWPGGNFSEFENAAAKHASKGKTLLTSVADFNILKITFSSVTSHFLANSNKGGSQ